VKARRCCEQQLRRTRSELKHHNNSHLSSTSRPGRRGRPAGRSCPPGGPFGDTAGRQSRPARLAHAMVWRRASALALSRWPPELLLPAGATKDSRRRHAHVAVLRAFALALTADGPCAAGCRCKSLRQPLHRLQVLDGCGHNVTVAAVPEALTAVPEALTFREETRDPLGCESAASRNRAAAATRRNDADEVPLDAGNQLALLGVV
jgi:hypothetical protein